jgi:hypothetical protein
VEKSFFFLSNMKFCFMKRLFNTALEETISVARPHWRESEKESTSELTTGPGERERKRERNQQNRALSKR